jgi:hypothetical protein
MLEDRMLERGTDPLPGRQRLRRVRAKLGELLGDRERQAIEGLAHATASVPASGWFAFSTSSKIRAAVASSLADAVETRGNVVLRRRAEPGEPRVLRARDEQGAV